MEGWYPLSVDVIPRNCLMIIGIVAIANTHRTAAQVILRWNLQKEHCIRDLVTPDHILEKYIYIWI